MRKGTNKEFLAAEVEQWLVADKAASDAARLLVSLRWASKTVEERAEFARKIRSSPNHPRKVKSPKH